MLEYKTTKGGGTLKKGYIIITEKPIVVELQQKGIVFGKIEEITSTGFGAERTNLSKVTLWGPDILHTHNKAEETYFCLEGAGEIFLNGKIYEFNPGTSVIIKPGTLHAARPKKNSGNLVFQCVSAPAFSYEDMVEDPVGRLW